jgi:ubiquinone/menaquinone biosynthesis C-methylase UbiE
MNNYDQFARLYDLEHRDFLEDIELYRNFAVRCDGPVLELGCGSGRVCVALAQAGIEVTGVDSSSAMLALAGAYAAEAGLQSRIRLQQADVRKLAFEAQFALAIFPLNGFLHLLTFPDQIAALQSAYRALMPGGFLIVDLPNPHTVFTPQTDAQFLLRRRFRSPDGGAIVSFTSSQTDLAEQCQRLTLFYDEVGDQGIVRRTTTETDLRFVYQHEMVLLLEQAGFAVDAVYGNYDLDPYETGSGLMLFVAFRPTAPTS